MAQDPELNLAEVTTTGIRGWLASRLLEGTDRQIVSQSQIDLVESVYEDYRLLNRQLEDIGWQVLDYAGRQPHELEPMARRRIVARARYVWMNDPQAGAAVELMNDFVFGRGVPRPRCKDKEVQEIVDAAWDDPDNQEVLTSYEAQMALGTDLSLQSNVFILVFDEGEDGKVKLSILRHDDVETIIPDPEKRHRSLFYMAYHRRFDFDYQSRTFKTDLSYQGGSNLNLTPTYYDHWRNVELAQEEEGRAQPITLPPQDQRGEGKVYHLRINRGSEQQWGVPRFQRTLRWYSSYNDFVKTRIDMAQAAAAIVMKRKIKGTPTQLTKDAAKLISRTSPLAGAIDPQFMPQIPNRPGGILVENDAVTHEQFKIDSGSANAMQDAQMIRAPIAAAERFTQAYFGDSSNSNLATATSLELPILKAVEGRQQMFEALIRFFVDRVIERAVDVGLIDEDLEPGEKEETDGEDQTDLLRQALVAAGAREILEGRELVDAMVLRSERSQIAVLISEADGKQHFRLVEAHEDKEQDEADTKRDLSYEFSMPSPLRRMMTELVTAVTQIAQTFDPNNTNTNLSRFLLTVLLGQGLEVEHPSDVVDDVIPEGYQDPMVEMQMKMAEQGGAGGAGGMLPGSKPGSDIPESPEANAYSAPLYSTMPEDMTGNGPYGAQEADVSADFPQTLYTTNRFGDVIGIPMPKKKRTRKHVVRKAPEKVEEARLTEPQQATLRGDQREALDQFQRDVIDGALDMLDGVSG